MRKREREENLFNQSIRPGVCISSYSDWNLKSFLFSLCLITHHRLLSLENFNTMNIKWIETCDKSVREKMEQIHLFGGNTTLRYSFQNRGICFPLAQRYSFFLRNTVMQLVEVQPQENRSQWEEQRKGVYVCVHVQCYRLQEACLFTLTEQSTQHRFCIANTRVCWKHSFNVFYT